MQKYIRTLLFLTFITMTSGYATDKPNETDAILSKIHVSTLTNDDQKEQFLKLCQDYHKNEQHPLSYDDLKQSFDHIKQDEENNMYRTFIATIDEKVIAFSNVALMPDAFNGRKYRRLARLDTVYVIPNYNGKKLSLKTRRAICQPLVYAVTGFCRNEKVKRITMDIGLPTYKRENDLISGIKDMEPCGKYTRDGKEGIFYQMDLSQKDEDKK